MHKGNESGRNMVEMLGVLAIVGVLSIGAIGTYTYAMNKQRSDEIIDSISKMAIVVSQQMETSNEISLGEFHDKTTNGYPVVAMRNEADMFGLVVSDIQEAVCNRLVSSEWSLPYAILSNPTIELESHDCTSGSENTVAFVFTKNFDKNIGASTDDDEDETPPVDPDIDNEEDCYYAGKIWCHPYGEDWNEGFCSNVPDCCKGVPLSQCQTCQASRSEFYVTNKLQGVECDYNGDGNMNDGICYPVAPSGDSCGDNDIQNLCFGHVKYTFSEDSNCVPVPCSMVGTCCQTYGDEGIERLLNQANTALDNGDIGSLVSIADQANTIQCTACDSTTGATSPLPDGTECQYADVEHYIDYQSFFPGTCQRGKCVKACGGFTPGWDSTECFSCDEPSEIEVYDSTWYCTIPCPNRKLIAIDNDGTGVCSLTCPSDSFSINRELNGFDCVLCDNPNPFYTPLDPDECLACGNRHIDANGRCVMDHCSTGYFKGSYFCVPCDEQEDTTYELETRYWTETKAECDKCANDGAHARTWHENGMCRY